jgi:hypothetical protein
MYSIKHKIGYLVVTQYEKNVINSSQFLKWIMENHAAVQHK